MMSQTSAWLIMGQQSNCGHRNALSIEISQAGYKVLTLVMTSLALGPAHAVISLNDDLDTVNETTQPDNIRHWLPSCNGVMGNNGNEQFEQFTACRKTGG